MGRDLKFKLLTLVFALTTLLALSACAVASAPSTTSEPADEPVESTDDATTTQDEDEVEPEPDEPENDSGSRTPDTPDEADAETEGTEAGDDGDVGVAEEPAEVVEESPGKPTRLQIDSIDVDADFEYVGVNDEGDMDVPQEWENVAWYEPGTVPGAQGNSVVAGHYDSYTDPAIFYDLGDLEEGDEVRITTEDGEELVFEVTEIELVHVDDADTSKIFGDTDERNLNLITCEGIWDADSDMYDERLIIYTTLVDE